MSHRRRFTPLLSLAGWAGFSVLAASTTAAQPLPVGPEIQVNAYTAGLQGVGGVASDAVGNVVVAIESGYLSASSQDGSGAGVFFRRLSPAGVPVAGDVQVNVFTAGNQYIPDVAMTSAGDFVVTWISEGQDGANFRATVYARLFSSDGSPKTGEFRLSTSDVHNEYYPTPAFCPDGGFVAVWQRFLPNGDDSDVLARWFDSAGAPRGSEIVVSSEDYPTNGYPDVACDLQGRVTIVWEACCNLSGDEADILLRRFDPDGAPLGDEVRVETEPGRTFTPSLALAPDGRFAVAWDTYNKVWARRFNADGAPITAPWRVSPPNPALPGGFEGGADALLDADGNLLVTWTSEQRDGSDYGVYGKWYDGSGAEKGGLFRLNTTTQYDQAGAEVAWQPGGFLAAWTSGKYQGPGQDGDQWGVIAQRFVIPPDGADPCLFGDDGLACDLLHDGGSAETAVAFGRPGDVPLLGNLDGDSRDDLCVYRNGRFLCDLAHDGGTAEVEIAFGVAGDVPLIGDLNGDGRDDACVRRGRRFACDTRHNGGTAEVQVVFGRVTDTALLGDVDGDGDDDPCLFRGDRFLCDTAHDGRGPEVGLFFGQPGDVPLLGDADGDGRDDACVYRIDRFLCDTAHDGGAAEVEVLFEETGGIPVLGNVNGF